jgi:hypothetical protein
MKEALRKSLSRLCTSYLIKVGSHNLMEPFFHLVCSPGNYIDKSKESLSDMYMEIALWELKR